MNPILAGIAAMALVGAGTGAFAAYDTTVNDDNDTKVVFVLPDGTVVTTNMENVNKLAVASENDNKNDNANENRNAADSTATNTNDVSSEADAASEAAAENTTDVANTLENANALDQAQSSEQNSSNTNDNALDSANSASNETDVHAGASSTSDQSQTTVINEGDTIVNEGDVTVIVCDIRGKSGADCNTENNSKQKGRK